MVDRYLEITWRKGKPIAAYLYLSRKAHAMSVRTEQLSPGLNADYDASGQAIGLEITSPVNVSMAEINRALVALRLEPMPDSELLPLKAA